MNLEISKNFVKKIFLAAICFAVVNFLAALAVPALIPPIENLAGRPLSYEVLLRLYIVFATVLLIWLTTMIGWWRPRAVIWRRGLIFLWCVFFALLFVFIFDQRWVLTEEYSWIRYPTAATLILSALLWLKLASQNRVNRIALSTYGLLFLGFIFAATDELFLLHERIGNGLQKFFHWPESITDLVTMFYGLISLIIILFIAKALNKILDLTRKKFLLIIYLCGIFLFITATLFDTLDDKVFTIIQNIADWLVWRGYEFSDFWFIIWKPKIFFNGWEEILELFAAVFFAFGAYGLIIKDRLFQPPPEQIDGKCFNQKQKTMLAISGLILIVVIFLFLTGLARQSDKNSFIKIADLKDGLFHTDDLFFHPTWGVIMANESKPSLAGKFNGPGVFILQNDKLMRLSDPQNRLRDIDSIAANSKAIYAADGAQGKIFKYACADIRNNKKCAWSELPKMKEFPRHPEALFVDENDLITVVDESETSITQIYPSGKVIKEKAGHALFKAPEGIIWHPVLKTFLITDDVTGAIFKYLPGRELEIFADAQDDLRFPEDIAVGKEGEIIVSDNGRREIIIFSIEGRELKRIRFPLLYRDLQGVAVGATGAIFAITANGFDNSSFISSRLWKISD